MEMRTIIPFVCLGLLLWIEPASAQKEYSLTVGIHRDVPAMTEEQVDDALDRASKLFKETDNQCDVTLKRDGPIKTFDFDSAPKTIRNIDDLESVHRVPADIKVVESIYFCQGRFNREGFWGCAWRLEGLPKTVIVARGMRHGHDPIIDRDRRYILWAHEFGHTKGLHHRLDNHALMTPCGFQTETRQITKDECTCLKDGPEGCPIPAPRHEATCPVRRQ
jgi:hypothetical protein